MHSSQDASDIVADRVEAERKMRQWQDASLASNAAMEREREQREELEIRAQELTRREEEARTETQDELRQERERYRVGVETIRTQLELEQDERRRVQEVATQAIQREQQMREKDPADLIFDVLDMDKDGQLTKGEFRAQTTDTFAFAGPRLTGRFGSNSGRDGRAALSARVEMLTGDVIIASLSEALSRCPRSCSSSSRGQA